MAFTQDFRTQRRNYNDGDTRIGEKDRIWYDSITNTLRISDGETPGGVAVGGAGGGGDYTLPTASTTVKGGVKVDGTTITISNQVISGFSGSYTDLTDKPTLFNGAYDSLSGKPTLFSGSYADLTNKPTLFSGSYTDLTNKPVIPSLTGYATETFVTSQGYLTSVGTISYNDLSNKPTLFSGSYTDLSNKPTLFSGSYTDLTDKPTIPTNTNQLTNGAGFITGYTETDPVFVAHASYNITSTQITNWDTAYGWGDHAGAGYLTSVGTISYNDLSDKPTLFSGSYTDLTNKPSLFSGSYNDLTDKPNLSSTYQFSVAADDSTQRLISTGETVKFIGAGGITTSSDAEGAVTITQATTTSLVNGNLSVVLNTDGSMTFPSNRVDGGANTIALWSSNQSSLVWRGAGGAGLPLQSVVQAREGLVNIGTTTGILTGAQTNYSWQFNTSGQMTFPDSTIQTTAWTGSVSYTNVTDKPTLFSGSYTDLTDKPTLFSGSYNDLTNKPTIPSDVSDLTDNDNLLGGSGGDLVAGNYVVKAVKGGSAQTVTSSSDAIVTFVDDFDPQNWFSSNKFQPNVAGYYSIDTHVWWDAGAVTNNQSNIQLRKNGTTQVAISQNQILTGSGYAQSISTIVYFNGTTDYVEVTAFTGNTTSQNINGAGTGTYFTAALYAYGTFSGSYNDLTNKPTIPTNVSQLVNDSGYVTASAIPAQFTFNVAADDSTQRTVGSQETVKFIGAGGITTASDAEGNITITQGSSSGVFSNQYSLTTTTSNATETELLVNGSTRIPVATNTSVNYIVNITARRTDTPGDYAFFEIRGVAANNAGTVSDIGSVYEVVVARTNASYLVDVRADDTNNSVNVYVTGVSGHTVDWKAVVQTIEV
jgi:hypothetical protein